LLVKIQHSKDLQLLKNVSNFYESFISLFVILILDKHTQSSSLSEKKALALVDHHALDLIQNNQRLITRVYPSAYRQDSSNVEAISFWNTGVQMGSNLFHSLSFMFRIVYFFVVALNFQTGDVSMSLNHGRFTDNNQCGYILKPAILRESNNLLN
jgi:hypothetical protein